MANASCRADVAYSIQLITFDVTSKRQVFAIAIASRFDGDSFKMATHIMRLAYLAAELLIIRLIR